VNEVARLIDGKVYAACKECGWNVGRTAHTTAACELSGKKEYHKPHLLVTAMKAVLIDNDDEGEKTPMKQSSSSKYKGGGNDCHDEAV
jgi:hypothetical protein